MTLAILANRASFSFKWYFETFRRGDSIAVTLDTTFSYKNYEAMRNLVDTHFHPYFYLRNGEQQCSLAGASQLMVVSDGPDSSSDLLATKSASSSTTSLTLKWYRLLLGLR